MSPPHRLPLLDRVVSSAAATPEGVRAKARSLILIGRNYDRESDHPDERLLASLLSDLVGFEVQGEVQATQEMHRRLSWEDAS